MDPQLAALLIGLLTNGLTALAGSATRRGKAFLKSKQSLEAQLTRDPRLDLIFDAALTGAAKRILDDTGSTRLAEFVSSPDAAALVRQLYAARLSNDLHSVAQGLESSFTALLALHLGQPRKAVRPLAVRPFEALSEATAHVLELAVESDAPLFAHEILAVSRFRILRDELNTVTRKLDLLTPSTRLDLRAITDFETAYRHQVAARHRYIVPPHFDAARKVPIDDLYVAPQFLRLSQQSDDGADAPSIDDLLARLYRVVLLGNPGGGKSTFALKLCHELATRYPAAVLPGRALTPILVVLRDYGAARKSKSLSILDFVESVARDHYQLQPPAKAFEYLLLNNRALIVFDGLDELLETNDRQDVTANVEAFCNLYPSTPAVVTSREVGYEQAPLDISMFETYRLGEFDDALVEEYAERWFSLDTDIPAADRKKRAAAFVSDSAFAPDLRANPLMLGLMCNICRGENYIPRNRPDVYEKCALMLFERWDKSRGIRVELPFEAHVSPAMKFLAHWIYEAPELQAGVTEEALVSKATEYLCPKRFEDPDEARAAARSFIEFCRGRAWVFTDTGTTATGDRLYQFTHRTFLEYFTAAHLVRLYATPKELARNLLPRIAKREWDVVAQLACQLQNKNIEGAGDALLSTLLDRGVKAKSRRGDYYLSFAARALEFMVPSPRVVRALVTASIKRAIQNSTPLKDPDYRPWRNARPGSDELVGDFLLAANENRAVVVEALRDQLSVLINGTSNVTARLAAEVGLDLPLALYAGTRTTPRPNENEWMRAFSQELCEKHLDRLRELAVLYPRTAFDLYRHGRLGPTEFVREHGIGTIFESLGYGMFPMWSISLAEWVIAAAVIDDWEPASARGPEDALSDLAELGDLLRSTPRPWLTKQRDRPPLLLWRLSDTTLRHRIRRRALFGRLAIVAAAWEIDEMRATRDPQPEFGEYLPVAARTLIGTRNGTLGPDVLKRQLRKQLEPEEVEFLVGWAKGEEPLVAAPIKRRDSAG